MIETLPSVNKVEAKIFLEKIYGMEIEKIHSVNVLGKVRRFGKHEYRTKAYKRLYVKLQEPVELPNIPKPLDKLQM